MKSTEEMDVKEAPRSRATTSTSAREVQDAVEATVWMLDEFFEEHTPFENEEISD